MDRIAINGKSVAKSVRADDASKTNYILIQTNGEPLDKAQKAQLKDLEVNINEFVGDEDKQVYLCGYKPKSLEAIRNLDFIDYANPYWNEFVVPSTIAVARQAATAGHDETIKVDVLLHHDIKQPTSDLVREIANKAGVEVSTINVGQGFVRLDVSPQKLDEIAGVDEVRVIHSVNPRKLFNDIARKILDASNVQIKDNTHRGEGEIVAVADTGFDKGSVTDVHDAFTGRVQELFAWGRPDDNQTDDPDGHGTHVCGSVLGSGMCNGEGLVEGTAPAARLVLQSTLSGLDTQGRAQLGGIPEDLGTLFDQAYQADARVHTNSWGSPLPPSGIQRPYDISAERIGDYVWNNQDMTILFAAGNDGQDKGKDGTIDGTINERSLGAEAAAKNCITVGATENLRPTLQSGFTGVAYTYGAFWPDDYPRDPIKSDHMANNADGLAAFSSRGQTAENRLKPDIVAPGTAILSTRSRNKVRKNSDVAFGITSDDRYFYDAGTSMATPLVAGCCAVLRETLLKNGYKEEEENGVKKPTASVIKALLINGAIPIRGQYMPKEVGLEPNPHSGFGRVDLAGSVIIPGGSSAGYGTGTIHDDQKSITIPIPIPKGSHPLTQQQQPNGAPAAAGGALTLKVTLTYADPKGAALANDLNLVVLAGERERHGNQVNQEFSLGSSQAFDRRNNVEQVIWPNVSAVAAAQVQLVIKAFRMTTEQALFGYAWKFF